MPPSLRLLLAISGGIGALKAVALVIRHRPRTATGMAVFLLAWPGVIPDYFLERHPAQTIDPQRFLGAWSRFAGGAVFMVLLAVYSPWIPDRLLGLAGIAALLL